MLIRWCDKILKFSSAFLRICRKHWRTSFYHFFILIRRCANLWASNLLKGRYFICINNLYYCKSVYLPTVAVYAVDVVKFFRHLGVVVGKVSTRQWNMVYDYVYGRWMLLLYMFRCFCYCATFNLPPQLWLILKIISNKSYAQVKTLWTLLVIITNTFGATFFPQTKGMAIIELPENEILLFVFLEKTTHDRNMIGMHILRESARWLDTLLFRSTVRIFPIFFVSNLLIWFNLSFLSKVASHRKNIPT